MLFCSVITHFPTIVGRTHLMMLLPVLLLLLPPTYLLSQYSDLHYQQFGMDDGLPTNSVYTVDQDSKGYIWVGTEAGLLRYDGYEFKNFTSEYGLIQNEIVSIRIDKMDRVWLNTTGPLCYFLQDSVYYLDNVRSPNIAWNFEMKEDAGGDLWFSYLSHIYRLSGKDLSIKNKIATIEGEGRLLGDVENGFWIYNGKDVINVQENESYDTISVDNAIVFRKRKSFFQKPYLLTESGGSLTSYNIYNGEKTNLVDGTFNCKDFIVEGNYLIGTDLSNGMEIYDFESFTKPLEDPVKLFSDHTIGGVFLDKDENLWIPTYKSGLYMIKPISEKVITEHQYVNTTRRPLESLAVNDDGSIIAGSEDGVLIRYSKGKFLENHISKGQDIIKRILDIETCGASGILMASDQGLLLFQDDSFTVLYDAASKKVDFFEGNCIISSYHAVFSVPLSYLKSLDSPLSSKSIFEDKNVNVFQRSRSYANSFHNPSDVWYATEEDGLHKISGDENIKYGNISNKLKSSIRDIIPLTKNAVAVASSGEGVQLITPDGHIIINTEAGLSSNIVKSLEYKGDKLYAGTIKGLSIIEFGDHFGEYSIEILDRSSGLITEQINDVVVVNDTIYMATHEGLLMVDDKNRPQTKKTKRPYLQVDEVLINDEVVNHLDGIELEPHQNNIIIRYTGVDVSSPTSLRYAFKMSGINDEWIYTRSRETHYSNLDADAYKFQVGVVTDNDIIVEPVSIEFIIKEPFIGSDIFKFLVLLVLLALLAFIVYAYNTYLQKTKLKDLVALRTKELDEKMEALEVVNSKMEQSNEALRNYAHITSHDLKSPLRNVGSFVQLLQKKNAKHFDSKDNEYVRYVSDGVKSMENTIDDLLAYSSLEKSEPTRPVPILDVVNQAIVDIAVTIEEKNAEIDIQGEFPILDGHFSRFKRLFQNLIENGLKYNVTDQPLIQITCASEENEYIFSVSDNGIGLDSKFSDKIFEMFQRLHDKQTYSGTGIGLAMCKKIVESYGGRIWVNSELNKGSTFLFTIPK